jgi:SPP1 family phage portal protein
MQNMSPLIGLLPMGQIFLINDGTPSETFLRTTISNWECSEYRKHILDAERYFRNINDVLNKKREVVLTDGCIGDSPILSNAKISHPYVRKLVRQKVSFLFASPFEIKAVANDDFTTVLSNNYFDDNLRKTIKSAVTHAINEGICFLLPYYNDSGALAFKRISAKNAIPFWADEEHTKLNAFIHFYDISTVDSSSENLTTIKTQKFIRKIEYFTPEGVWYYQINELNQFEPDPDAAGNDEMNFHFYQGMKALSDTGVPLTNEDGTPIIDMVGKSWDKVPIIAFKYNEDELPVLSEIKSMVDDYDGITSAISDNIHDVPDSIKIVKGYSGTDPNTFVRNVATYRVIFLDPEGAVDNLTSDIHIADTDLHLDRLRKDIFEAGDGIDIQTDQLGDVSGAALKYRFSPLSEDVNDLAEETKSAIQQLVYYICYDLKLRKSQDYFKEVIEIKFPQVAIMNEAETVDNISKSMNIVSRQTLLAHHPYVTNVEEELKLFDAQQKADIALENAALPAVTKTNTTSSSGTKKTSVIGDY